ncbi:MAG TPA: hypothetical protein VEB40_16015 [Flavipsychrobacter sp.]|nr:hypothetical protein [Flavipsychrobacter sp.]
MKHLIFILIAAVWTIGACNSPKPENKTAVKSPGCSDGCCKAKHKKVKLACKLHSDELRKRKETVLASLKAQVTEKKELPDGYAFKFSGSDKTVDELTEFIKTERECCEFFTFNLSIAGDKNEAWLQLTGPEGAKDFITSELGL